MGLSETDTLTEVIVPIGKIPANYEPLLFPRPLGGAFIYGSVTDEEATFLNQTVAEVTLRDEDYDADNPEKNYTLQPAILRGEIQPKNRVTNINVSLDQTKEITYSKSDDLVFEINTLGTPGFNTLSFNSQHEISKAHLTLPTDLGVKLRDIKIESISDLYDRASDVIDLTRLVQRSQKAKDDQTVYTFDFSSIQGIERYIGLNGDYDHTPTNRGLRVTAHVENNLLDERDITYDQRLFVELKDISGSVIAPSLNEVDPYELSDNDTLLFTNSASKTNFVRLSKQNILDMQASAKLESDRDYQTANKTFTLTNIDQSVNLRYNIKNPNEVTVENVELYLPIPKKGQDFGDNFQEAAFAYGLSLKSTAQVSGAFKSIFDISYATVSEEKLDGSINHTTETLGAERFEVNPVDFSKINLVRVKTKVGVQVPELSDNNITFNLGLLDVTPQEDGNSLSWNPY
ncbi:hypothetical protein ACVV62_08670 [Streptococcus pluranimalium]